MISDLLEYGEENARSGRQLAGALGVNIRNVTAAIRQERLNGAPICAATGKDGAPAGYYLGDRDDVLTYCRRLRHRAGEMFAARRALLDTIGAAGDGKDDQQ